MKILLLLLIAFVSQAQKFTFDSLTLAQTKQGYNIIGWDNLKAQLESVEINNVGSNAYAKQSIINDGGKVLKAQVIADDPTNGTSTTRAQLSLRFKEGYNAKVYHFSHRMKLHPDIAFLKNYPSNISWFTLIEIWNQHIDAMNGDEAGSARWDLSIFKDNGIGKKLYWNLKAEYMQPSSLSYKRLWYTDNRTVEIPFGKWFTLDVQMIRGGGVTGKMIVTMTIDGQQSVVLFNQQGHTRYPGDVPNKGDDYSGVQLKSWQPFKLYLDAKYLDWMRLQKKEISAEYSNLIWYKD